VKKLGVAVAIVALSIALNVAAINIAPHIDGSGRLETSIHFTLPFWHLFFPPMLSGPSPIAALFALSTNITLVSLLLYFVQVKRSSHA